MGALVVWGVSAGWGAYVAWIAPARWGAHLESVVSAGWGAYVGWIAPAGWGAYVVATVTAAGALSGWIGLAVAVRSVRRVGRRLERVARAEHELRGPVAVLALTRERMEREPTGRRYARALEVELERLTAALADLTAARTGRRLGGPPPAPGRSSDLRAFAGGALAGWAPALRAAGRRTRFDWKAGRVPLPRDRGRVAQALGNLVANAAEHGAGEVEVRGRRVPGGVRVEVRNGLREESAVRVDAERGRRLPVAMDAAWERGQGLPIAVDVGSKRGRGLAIAVDSGSERGRGLPIAADAARELGGTVVTERGARSFRAALELPVSEASMRLRERLAAAAPGGSRSAASRGSASAPRPGSTPVMPPDSGSAGPTPTAPIRFGSTPPRAPKSKPKRPGSAWPGAPGARRVGPRRPPRPPMPPRPPVPPRRVIGNRRRM